MKHPCFRYLVWFLAAAGCVAGCRKIVNPNLKDAAPQMVIEGNVTNGPGPSRVSLSRSVYFSADNRFPPVTGAAVSIMDSTAGVTVPLQETDSGVYETLHLIGLPFHTYQLLVVADGISYTAQSKMPFPVPLDSINLEENINLANQTGLNAVANFQDPPGTPNYYQLTETVNRRELPDVFLFNDRLSDGRYIRESLFNDSNYLHRGDTLVVKLSCVDEAVYNYFFTLSAGTVNSANNSMTATPANPVSNLSNGALGYFSAHTVSAEFLVVNH